MGLSKLLLAISMGVSIKISLSGKRCGAAVVSNFRILWPKDI